MLSLFHERHAVGVERAIQVLGGYGYKEFPVEALFRDAVFPKTEGTQEVQRIVITRALK